MKFADRGTTRVARALLVGGPQTAPEVATALGLTPTAVRRHLDRLVELGQASCGEQAPYGPSRVLARRRGRPAQVYVLTDEGRESFHQSYDDLATQALQFVHATVGVDGVREFANQHAATLEARYDDVRTAPDPIAALAERLSADGYAASVVDGPHSAQLCQHHCPVGHVAEQFPQLCEAEAEAFSRLLGTHVTRLATLAGGDGICTTLVPRSTVGAASSTGTATGTATATTARRDRS